VKVLHFAAENFARVPANLVAAERSLGHESLLATLIPSAQGFRDEDVCLNAPFVRFPAAGFLKRRMSQAETRPARGRRDAAAGPVRWAPSGPAAEVLFRLRDRIWMPAVRRFFRSVRPETFDGLVLDGGLGFLRTDPFVPALKAAGLRIAAGYYGSDFRTRGVIPAIDRLADYRFTFEFDHTLLDPTLDFLPYPFRLPEFERRPGPEGDRVRIGHSPTNRAIKGTDDILRQLGLLAETHPVDVVLIQGLPHSEALAVKSTCDIFVDTLGELGYGVSGLEAMAMGIPTAAEILPDFESRLGGHPFIPVTAVTLARTLAPYVESEALRRKRGEESRVWVESFHNPLRVASHILSRLFPSLENGTRMGTDEADLHG
jgi:hypothetical protein